jgi:hypothetical protein
MHGQDMQNMWKTGCCTILAIPNLICHHHFHSSADPSHIMSFNDPLQLVEMLKLWQLQCSEDDELRRMKRCSKISTSSYLFRSPSLVQEGLYGQRL